MTDSMQAMVLKAPGKLLSLEQRPIPEPGAEEVLVKVHACAVCRTDLHVVDGELPDIPYPIIPGHEIVGKVVKAGLGADWSLGTRVGIPWLGYTCGHCYFCENWQENLCDAARFTGYQLDGGFAEYVIAHHRYCFEIDSRYEDAQAAPLMCAGLIGYRSLVMAGDAQRLGLYGFGAAAHIVAQIARHEQQEVYAFTRPGDAKAQAFARNLGAVWAGDSTATAPCLLDAAIIFAPVGSLVPIALKAVRKGGVVVCGGIHMSDIPAFPYGDLWGERQIRSVANLTRHDAEAFLALAPEIPVKTHIETFSLAEANSALARLRGGELEGAAVLIAD